MTQESVIEFNDISLEYGQGDGKTQAIEHVTLRIEQGEFVTWIGPSGCGKSSLLSLAAGTQLPTAGSVSFHGQKIFRTDDKRGMMFQQPTLFPWLSVIDNVAFGPKMKGIPKKQRRSMAMDYLKRVQMEDFADKRTYELSGGMKQRVALARTLINDPEVILMDEPFGALDPLTKRSMQELLAEIWEETQKTIIFVTHDIEEAVLLGTRVVVFSARPGRVLTDLKIPFDFRRRDEMDRHPGFKQMIQEIHQLLIQ